MNAREISLLVLTVSAAALLVHCSDPSEPTNKPKQPPASRLDAFVVNYGQYNQVYLNDGHGSFTVHDVTASGDGSSSADYSHAVALGDLDGK
ncbi:MAG: FG-GAP-like repeat-containing protein [Candidatus Krumholzibacteria bacterium]|nr:FG-GAP-like repeat-containing protein [Candidatus Krumholzibacteria bacterium]